MIGLACSPTGFLGARYSIWVNYIMASCGVVVVYMWMVRRVRGYQSSGKQECSEGNE